MSIPFLDPEPNRASVIPAQDEQPDFLEQLAAQTAESELGPDDLVITEEEIQPVGRTWVYDFAAETFVYGASGGRAPLTVHGQQSVLAWLEKCLHTQRGAHPIHPPGYGLEGGYGLGGVVDELPFDLEARIREAAVFNPAIVDVDEFDLTYDPDDTVWYVACTLHLADGSSFPVRELTVSV